MTFATFTICKKWFFMIFLKYCKREFIHRHNLYIYENIYGSIFMAADEGFHFSAVDCGARF